MNLLPQAQAILLLTVSFGKNGPKSAKPLSKNEWARFAVWLKDHDLEPSNLLKGDVQSQLSGMLDKTISADRIQFLLERGATLGIALEKWERAGLWVMTRSDPDYPERLKRRLKLESPAVLFGCGNKNLLNKGGVAVIGSRNASEDDLTFTNNFGKETASQGYSIVSGGARGVDQSAMSGALDNEGTAIGVMADSLLKATASAKYREKIMTGDLVLITPFNPEAGFNVGNAMGRNRYIYCLADAAVVISSTTDKGGTWNGAIEDLRAGWVPLWVKNTENSKSGNSILVSKGANWLPDDRFSVKDLMEACASIIPEPARLLQLDDKKPNPNSEAISKASQANNVEVPVQETEPSEESVIEKTPQHHAIDFFELFILKFQEATSQAPLKIDEIASLLELGKSQASAWVKRGVSEGKIKKLQRPVRYQAADKSEEQASLF
jgi:predicted Rossmann fold nucleotide-binding protein DprA/Smf involved in DNA uptake